MLTREQWLQDFIQAARPHFERVNAPLPANIRVAVGFTSQGARGKAIGQCWAAQASADAHFEIFIHPKIADSHEVGAILTHELVHAAVGLEAAHGPVFRRAAVAIGLEGKMTATVVGADWHLWADAVIEALGPIPHAKLSSSLIKKQGTRMLKVSCDDCGFTFRSTAKWLDGRALTCPDADCGGLMTCEA